MEEYKEREFCEEREKSENIYSCAISFFRSVSISTAIRMNLLKSGILLFMVGFSAADISSVFKENQIFSEVISDAPLKELEVQYGEKMVKLGEECTPAELKNAPKINYKADADTDLYTVIMIDFDVIIKDNQFLYWLVVNIDGDDISKGDLTHGNILAPYLAPSPLKGSGLQTYVFLVFKQTAYTLFSEPQLKSNENEGRKQFSIKKFAEAYQFGNPVAGNMFTAQLN